MSSHDDDSPDGHSRGGALDWARDAGEADVVIRDLEVHLARRRRRRLGAMAAGFALVGVGLGVFRSARDVPPAAAAEIATNATVLKPGTRTLADGTVVELKGDARVEVAFGDTVRRVTLQRGEAHFQVAKDPARPFVVDAAGVEVRAVGTAFSVQLGFSAVDIVVTEGMVAVDRAPAAVAASTEPGTPAGASRALEPNRAEPAAPAAATAVAGTRVVVALAPVAGEAAGPVLHAVSADELEQRLAWRRVRLEFTDTPLAEVVRMFNQSAGDRPAARLVLDEAALGSLQVSGVLRPDNVASLLRLLEKEFQIEAIRRGGEIGLRRMR